ncbi:hypothetical protein DPMN_037520 [Dreissena polymorpha]|uniref:Uncharacterized protein n=1 Tax=Dreissena polymorpha TaxID=45954 RepID=A0A9D4MCT2_DREPO|nr:hypothetical protein DPMN_037520 [Dreissena polymorpha]
MILPPSVLELSSDNHLVDGLTDRPTDMSKAIYPLFFEGGHNKPKQFLLPPHKSVPDRRQEYK